MALWLVTGGTGFLGGHVLRALAAGEADGADVAAAGRTCPSGWNPRGFLKTDLEQADSIARTLAVTQPDVVIHAAGRTPPASPGEFDRGNVRSTIHLLDACRRLHRPVRVVLIGSAAELGPVPESELPVAESRPCRPADAYGWSKLLATNAGLLASRPPVEVVVARVFNPIGPGTPENNALGSFAARLLDPNPGPMLTGDLGARRDFIDARDVARAVVALGRSGRAGWVYHVGTGASRRVGDGLQRLIRRSGRTIEVREDPTRFGGTRAPRDSRADITRIVRETGWRPAISFEQSLDDLWDFASARQRRALPLTA